MARPRAFMSPSPDFSEGEKVWVRSDFLDKSFSGPFYVVSQKWIKNESTNRMEVFLGLVREQDLIPGAMPEWHPVENVVKDSNRETQI